MVCHAKIAFFITSLIALKPAYALDFDQQAERLQKISASLLDAFPFAEPNSDGHAISLQLPISFIPKPNSTVGGKRENVPSSPLHLIPTAKAHFILSHASSIQAWGGYLPPGGEKLLGLDASLKQYVFGISTEIKSNFIYEGSGVIAGYQFSKANVTGHITGSVSNDEFDAKTQTYFVCPYFKEASTEIWGNICGLYKSTESRLQISSDQTDVSLTDKLRDSDIPLAIQIALGKSFDSIDIAIGFLYVPKRLMMPRILLGYTFEMGGNK